MKMLLVLAMVMGLGAPGTGERSIPAIPDEELSLKGISLGQNQDDVFRSLGQPSRQLVVQGTQDQLLFEYPDLEVVFVDGMVDQLTSSSTTVCTPSRVCPGVSLDAVRKIYGYSPLIWEDKESLVEYYAEVGDCWLELSFHQNRVQSIRARCQV